MKGQRGKPFELKDFTGGLVTKSPPKNIDTKFAIDCSNVWAQGLYLTRRDGVSAVNSMATTGNGNGLYNWVRGSDTTAQWLISIWGGSNVTKMDITAGAWDGTIDPLSADGMNGTAFTNNGGFMYFANFNGVLLMANENREHIQKMTVSDSSYFNIEYNGSGTAPLAKFIFSWKNHTWFMNCAGSEDQVVHSSVNSYNNFTGSTYGANNLLTENDIGINGGFILNGRLYAMKAFSIHRFTYTGSPSPLVEIKTIKSTTGTRSPRTIKNVTTTEGEVAMFLGSNRKLYSCDGQDTQEITNSIDVTNGVSTVYMQAINAAALENCYAAVHEDMNWYELFICIGTATSPSYSIIYDYNTKALWPMSNRNYSTGNVSDDGSGKRRVYVQGATNGKIYLTNSTNSDDGTAISYNWVSGKFGPSILLQKIDEVEVETDITNSAPTFSWRGDWETNWVTQVVASGTNSHNWSPSRIDNMIQFRISGSDTTVNAFRLWTIALSERLLGGGK